MTGLCVCGCPDIAHHTSMTRDGMAWYGECLRYGSNETGGMRPTIWCRLFPPPRSELGRARMWLADRVRAMGGRWYVDHCHAFEPDTESMAAYIVNRYGP